MGAVLDQVKCQSRLSVLARDSKQQLCHSVLILKQTDSVNGTQPLPLVPPRHLARYASLATTFAPFQCQGYIPIDELLCGGRTEHSHNAECGRVECHK